VRIGSIARVRQKLHAGLRNETEARSRSSAIVFAPHQDDETLGCGGTIILKRELSTPVTCVFMTDGTTSHQTFMDRESLHRLRRAEALEATAVLGLDRDQVHFLDFPDSKLGNHHAAAVAKVTVLLDAVMPDEVYVPYRRDGTPDHEATYRIVVESLQHVRHATRVLEYPLWFWNRWPWVQIEVGLSRDTWAATRGALDAQLGLTMLREFGSGVFVRNVLERKRDALAKYRSQMNVLQPGKPWPTLGDVSGGEFLDCFLQDFEVYRCANSSARAAPVAGSRG
jgi:LmbE family N-acetylglucosaminyl deacetylase